MTLRTVFVVHEEAVHVTEGILIGYERDVSQTAAFTQDHNVARSVRRSFLPHNPTR